MSSVDAANITDRFSYELSKTNKFILIERELLDEIIEEQKTQLSGCVADECAVEVGRLSGARMVIAGKVSKTFGLYSISARLIDVETGEIVAQVLEADELDVQVFFSQRVKNAALKLAAEGSQSGAGGSSIAERITNTEKGTVVFSLDKTDAGIFIDGSYSSQASGTNVTLQLSEGSHDIKFVLPGHSDWVKQVNVLVGETLNYEVKFVAGFGSNIAVNMGAVVVRSTPGNAIVFIDGVEQGPTPQQVTKIGVGSHLIRVEKPLYHPYIEEVDVVADGVNQVKANLHPKFGKLSMTSEPTGAAVYLNDQLKGKTPLEIAQLASGDYTIRLTKELYHTHEEKFTVTDGSDSQRPITLSPAFGTLAVVSNPVGAEVYVDGQLKGKSPREISELPSGAYRLLVQMPLYETLEMEVIIEDGKTNKQSVFLAPRFGTLIITGSPEGAIVKANGNKIGNIPLINYHIGTGSVELAVEQDNYHPESQFLQVEKEGFYPLNIDLVPHAGTVLAFTEPPDAQVILDDKMIGPSPQIIKDVPIGSHTLELNHPDFLPITQKFDLQLDERKEFNLTLVTYEGSIQQEIDKLALKRNVSIGAGVGFTALAVTFKILSNSAYSDYEGATDPAEVTDFYDRTKSYNFISAISLGGIASTVLPSYYYQRGINKLKQELLWSKTKMVIENGNMVMIPGGAFRMGDVWDDGGDDEKPAHTVTLSSFYISTYEVTQEQYEQVTGKNSSGFKGKKRPVEQVSWIDALKFCNEASEATGLNPCYTFNGTDVICDWSANGYRLPTEAEWEYAARSGGRDDRKWSGTSLDTAVQDYAWGNKNSNNKTMVVGLKKPNEFGLFDMNGNVWEWCWDKMAPYDPWDQIDPKGGSKGQLRVLRGGGWNNGTNFLRNSIREGHSPLHGNSEFGFRIVRANHSSELKNETKLPTLEVFDLNLNLEIGKTYSHNYFASMEVIAGNDLAQSVAIEMGWEVDYEVIEHNGDEYLFRSAYKNLSMNMQSAGENIKSSSNASHSLSASPTLDEMLSVLLNNMIDKYFFIRMDESGYIVGISEMENLLSTIFDNLPELTEDEKDQLLGEIKSSFGKDAFKGSIESVTAMLPSRGVQVNDVWKNSLNMGPSMPGIINNTFTLSEVSDEYLIITGSSLIKINGTSQVDPYGLPTRYNMSGKKNSKIKIDPVTNWIIEAEYDQEFSGVSETSTRANILGGQDTPMSIKMRIEIQR